MNRDEIVKYVKECRREDGGYGPAEQHDSHLLHTLCAVQVEILTSIGGHPTRYLSCLFYLSFNRHFLTRNNVRKTCMLIWTPKYLLDDTIFDAYCLTLSDRNNPGSTRVHRCRGHCPIRQESAETRWKLHWGFFQRGAHYFMAISLFWFEKFTVLDFFVQK